MIRIVKIQVFQEQTRGSFIQDEYNETDTNNWSWYNYQIGDNRKYHWNEKNWWIKMTPRAIVFLIRKKLLPECTYIFTHSTGVNTIKKQEMIVNWKCKINETRWIRFKNWIDNANEKRASKIYQKPKISSFIWSTCI